MSMRYDRQMRIPEWDQSKIIAPRVAMHYDNIVGDHLDFIAAALGIHNSTVYRYGMPREFLKIYKDRIPKDMLGKFIGRLRGDMYSFEELLKALNPHSNHLIIDSAIANKDLTEALFEGHETLVDVSSYATSKRIAQNWLRERNKIGIIAKPESNKIKMYTYMRGRDNKNLEQVIPKNPYPRKMKIDHLVAMGGAALLLEELKNILMGWTDKLSDKVVEFSIDRKRKTKENYSRVKALYVGCGASASSAAIGMAPLCVGRVDMMDPDTVDETNLNRQLPYFDAVGEEKAPILSYRIQEMSGFRTKSTPYVQYFDEKTSVKDYDIVFDFVDHTKSRLVIQEACTKDKVPLISVGTNYDLGQAIVYLPGQSMTIDQVMGLTKIIENEERARAQDPSCIYVKNPSVVMANCLMAVVAVNEFRKLFYPKNYGPPAINGMIKYEADSPRRLVRVNMG